MTTSKRLPGIKRRQALRRLMAYGHHRDVRRAIEYVSSVRTYYEITADDVGKPNIHAFGSSWSVVGFIGRILPTDVGKRVYVSNGILSVENDEQRAARLARTSS